MSGELPDTVQIKGNELKVLKVDEAVNTTFVCEVKNRLGIRRDQVTVVIRGELADTSKRTPLAYKYTSKKMSLQMYERLI